MKKLILAAVCILGVVAVSNAQEKGQVNLNAGIELRTGDLIPIYAGADYFVTDDISVGGRLSYASKKVLDVSVTYFGIGVNGNYHFNRLLEIPSEWDVYGGLGFTYYSVSFSDDLSKNLYDPSTTIFGLQVGGRYFFSPNFAVNLELTAGTLSGVGLGVTYKL